MAVDVRDSSSFIHEYSHYLDYTYDQSGIISSTSHSFKDIRNIYKASLLKLIQIAEKTRTDLAQAVHIKKCLHVALNGGFLKLIPKIQNCYLMKQLTILD